MSSLVPYSVRAALLGLMSLLLSSLAQGSTPSSLAGRPTETEPEGPVFAREQLLEPQGYDTLAYNFTSSLDGWTFFHTADTVQEYYPDVRCVERTRMKAVGSPFALAWSSFGGTGSAQMTCAFDGYYTDSCHYSWQIKSIQSPVPATWDGASRIEARIYKSFSATAYAMIGYMKPGDTVFSYVGWTSALPTNAWTTISLQEPTAGAFSDLAAVSVLIGSYSGKGAIYVDLVRRIKFTVVTPTLISPANLATIENNLPTFTWSDDGANYTLQVDTSASFPTPRTYTGITEGSYTLTTPLPNSGGYLNTHYYWRVQANYTGIGSAFSAANRFDITGTHDVPSEFATISAAYTAFGLRSPGTVRVAPGTYTGASNCNIGSFGERPVSIVSSAGPATTIIDCQGLYPGFNYDYYAPGGVVLQGFTIRNASGGNGAAVFCWTASPTIRNCIIEGSTGRGIYCRSGSQARIENCVIQNNDSAGVQLETSANITITGGRITGNSGYGLRMWSGTTATISGCQFGSSVTNALGESGAIRALQSVLTVTGCAISNGTGNGIESYGNNLTVTKCDLVGNRAQTNGGAIAIYWSEENTVSIDSCFFSGNTASTGGGLYLAQVGTLSINHSTFVNNKTGIDPNVEGNYVGPIMMANCIIANSTTGPGIDDADGIIGMTITCTDIYGNAGGNWVGVLSRQLGLRGNIAADPLFCNAAGSNFTIAATSPCAAAHTTCGGMGVYPVGCTLNRPPVFVERADTTILESQTLILAVAADDPDEDIPDLSTGALPVNGTFADHGDGSGSLTFTPSYEQAGTYTVTFFANDGELADTMSVQITVTNVNRPPVFATIADDTVAEGETLVLEISASDPDGTAPRLTAVNLMQNATFTDLGGGRGRFTFAPDFGQAGQYAVRFLASDGTLSDTADVAIVVTGTNRPPVIAPIADREIAEQQPIEIEVTATDPDGTIPTLSASGLPPGATFSDHGDGSGQFNWTPSYAQSGVHVVTFAATDGVFSVSAGVTITVTNVNRRPAWVTVRDTVMHVGQTLIHAVEASDPDSDPLTLSALGVPPHATFTDRGSGSGEIAFTPELDQVGTYAVSLIASDGFLADTNSLSIGVRPGAIIAVQPDTVRFVIDAVAAELSIENHGEAQLEWSGSADVPWLALSPGNGTIAVGGSIKVAVAVDSSQLASGYHWAHIDLLSNGGNARVTLVAGKSLALTVPPILGSVQINEVISLPFNGLISTATLLEAVVVESRKGAGCTTDVVTANDRVTLIVAPAAGDEFLELDSVIIHISPGLTTSDGIPLRSRDSVRTFVTGAAVWPGDTDHNGIVDERDVLPIGRYFDSQGPPRGDGDWLWSRHLARVVLGENAWSPYAAIYADADGNGAVEAEDICGVADNWLKTIAGMGRAGEDGDDGALAGHAGEFDWSKIRRALIDCPESRGRTELIGILDAMAGAPAAVLPDAVELSQNRPNPFNPTTVIEFNLPKADWISLTVYNIRGQQVRLLSEGTRPAGQTQLTWNGRDDRQLPVASGVYYYVLRTSSTRVGRTMVLLR